MDTFASSPKLSTLNRTPLAPRILAGAVALGAVAWVFTAGASMAFAQTSPEKASAQTTARVTYADLDISTEPGARALLQRISVAAENACGVEVHSPLMPREAGEHHKCVTSAVDKAVGRIDAPLLAQLYKASPMDGGVTLAAR